MQISFPVSRHVQPCSSSVIHTVGAAWAALRAVLPGRPVPSSPAAAARCRADRLIGHVDTTFEHQLLHVAEAQWEPVLQPDAMADDLGRTPEPCIRRTCSGHDRRSCPTSPSRLTNLTVPSGRRSRPHCSRLRRLQTGARRRLSGARGTNRPLRCGSDSDDLA